MNKIEQLENQIKHHNKRYWTDNNPEISDMEYDKLVERLKNLDPNNKLFQRITSEQLHSMGKVKHHPPMLSLNKVYTLDELKKWLNKIARNDVELFWVQPKYDGVSAELHNGVLSTRGNGLIGENISDKMSLINFSFVEHNLKAIRGELVIEDDVFEKKFKHIKREDGSHYKNQRNGVAGVLGLKDQKTVLQLLQDHGKLVTFIPFNSNTHALTKNALIENWENLVDEIVTEVNCPIDGVVVRVGDFAYFEDLGSTAHHPRGAIAFKFANQSNRSMILDIDWQIGKGCLTPVAIIRPVDISGSTIRKATLHNVKNVIDKDIRVGDEVIIQKAGDVIPYVVRSKPGKKRKLNIPDRCPCCDSELDMEGVELVCTNSECFETNAQRLVEGVRRIGIEQLGEPTVRKMMRQLDVKDLSDIFKLHKEDIQKLDGFAERSSEVLFQRIQDAAIVEDHKLLAALCMKGIGPNVTKDLLSGFTIRQLKSMQPEDMERRIKGIGLKKARMLYHGLKEHSELINKLSKQLTVVQTKDKSQPFDTICFTGKMPEKRSYYEALAKNNGYLPVDTVTGDLSLLVTADSTVESSKLKKAFKMGIKVVSLDAWLENIKE